MKSIQDIGILIAVSLMMISAGPELVGSRFQMVARRRPMRPVSAASLTVGILFRVRNVGLPSAIAITLLNRPGDPVLASACFHRSRGGMIPRRTSELR